MAELTCLDCGSRMVQQQEQLHIGVARGTGTEIMLAPGFVAVCLKCPYFEIGLYRCDEITRMVKGASWNIAWNSVPAQELRAKLRESGYSDPPESPPPSDGKRRRE